MAKTPIEFRIKAFDEASAILGRVQGRLAGFSDKLSAAHAKSKASSKLYEGFGLLGGKLKNAGKALSLGVTAPIVGIGVASLKSAGDFEELMAELKAKTGASKEDLKSLGLEARKLGLSTQFGASESVQAMIELGKAGFKTGQIMSSTKDIINLAGSENLDLGTAAQYVADTMAQFGMKASDTKRIADVLAKAAGESTISVDQLADSLSYAGGIAKRNNISFEETAAVLAVFGSRGVKGSRAGTALATGISNISSNKKAIDTLKELGFQAKDLFDKKDQLGSFVRLIQKLEKIKPNNMQLTKIFGEEAGRSIQQIIGASNELIAARATMTNADGFAQKQADEKSKTFNGAMKRIRNTLEDAAISIASSGLLELATKVVNKLSSMVKWFTTLSPEIQRFVAITAGIAAIAGPIIYGLGQFVIILGSIPSALSAVGTGISLLSKGFGLMSTLGSGALAFLLSPVGLVLAGVVGLGAAIYIVYKNWGKIARGFENLTQKAKYFFGLSKVQDRDSIKVSSVSPYAPAKNVSHLAGDFAANKAAADKAEVTVRFDQLPPGARVEESKGNTANLNLVSGWVMGGAR